MTMPSSDASKKSKRSKQSTSTPVEFFQVEETPEESAPPSAASSSSAESSSSGRRKRFSGFKDNMRKASTFVKRKLTPRSRKNTVKEISIKPETARPGECWVNEGASSSNVSRAVSMPSIPSSSRSTSANSKEGDTSKNTAHKTECEIEDFYDDGIPVVYDAEYQGEL